MLMHTHESGYTNLHQYKHNYDLKRFNTHAIYSTGVIVYIIDPYQCHTGSCISWSHGSPRTKFVAYEEEYLLNIFTKCEKNLRIPITRNIKKKMAPMTFDPNLVESIISALSSERVSNMPQDCVIKFS